ncbi:hypothetical protein ACE939_08470 [Aquimarina sp. W85]|uniref:hypothetical protein n=1 Tax=Aquimarina rhodophyticola TaxID=3342246 RepID=UPI00366D0727
MINTFEIREVRKKEKRIDFDFFIDGKPLSNLLNINRFGLGYCDFDLDRFEVDKEMFPLYDRKKINTNSVLQFLGKIKPSNQFQTNRIVIYRCHCGCDYCGIISFRIEKENDFIIWKDITYENDDFLYKKGKLYKNDDFKNKECENEEIEPIIELKFDKKEYELEFEKYLKEYCA